MPSPIKKIAIMGCGWLGFPLAQELIRCGYEISGSTTSEGKLEELRKAGIRPYLIRVDEQLEGDIKDFFKTDLLILNIPPGRRRPDVAGQYPQEVRLVMERARQDGLSRLVFISSTGVYAEVGRAVTEADECWAEDGSGLALARTEQYLQSLPGLQLTVLRLAGLVGGERKAGRFLAGKQNVANGDAPVNMVHREDCIRIIRQLIEDQIWGETFNVCADEHPTRREFYIRQAVKDGFEPPTFAEAGPPVFKIISNEKLKRQLNYRFLYPDPLEF